MVMKTALLDPDGWIKKGSLHRPLLTWGINAAHGNNIFESKCERHVVIIGFEKWHFIKLNSEFYWLTRLIQSKTMAKLYVKGEGGSKARVT
jgi:hypothetical protein